MKTADLKKCYELKAELLVGGIHVIPPFPDLDFKYVIKSLYGYEKSKSDFIYPQEIILVPEAKEEVAFHCTVRRNDQSPWKLLFRDSGYFLEKDNVSFSVGVPPKPPFYDVTLMIGTNQIHVSNYVQKLGQDLLAIVIFNSCEYYSRNVQCAFCEIAETYKENRHLPRPKKNITETAYAICYALSHDHSLKGLLINGGNLSKSNDHTYLEIIRLLDEIKKIGGESLLKDLDIGTIVMAPQNFQLLSEIRQAGVTEIYLNLEFWQEEKFLTFTPGKAGYGRERFFEILQEAVKVFGRGSVYSNLIYGVQSISLTPPYQYDPDMEERILLEGLDALASIDVVLTNTIYHSSGKNKLGPISIDADSLSQYHLAYGKKMNKMDLLTSKCSKRNSVFGRMGSFPNSLNNEAYYVSKK